MWYGQRRRWSFGRTVGPTARQHRGCTTARRTTTAPVGRRAGNGRQKLHEDSAAAAILGAVSLVLRIEPTFIKGEMQCPFSSTFTTWKAASRPRMWRTHT